MSESEAARLSRLLFESREVISMFKDIVEIRAGKEHTWSRRIISEIDEYRAERGWSPDGFGGETADNTFKISNETVVKATEVIKNYMDWKEPPLSFICEDIVNQLLEEELLRHQYFGEKVDE